MSEINGDAMSSIVDIVGIVTVGSSSAESRVTRSCDVFGFSTCLVGLVDESTRVVGFLTSLFVTARFLVLPFATTRLNPGLRLVYDVQFRLRWGSSRHVLELLEERRGEKSWFVYDHRS